MNLEDAKKVVLAHLEAQAKQVSPGDVRVGGPLHGKIAADIYFTTIYTVRTLKAK